MSEEIQLALTDLRRAAMELWAAAETIKSPFFAAQIGESLALAHVRAQSPWISRNEAGDYAAHCGVCMIDKAEKKGLIKKYQIGGRVAFKKAEIDAAIESGDWPSTGTGTRRTAKAA